MKLEKQLEFEFMEGIRKEEKRKARNFRIFLATLYIIAPLTLIEGIKYTNSHPPNPLDDSNAIKGNYSESIEEVPSLLRPYVQVGFPYF